MCASSPMSLATVPFDLLKARAPAEKNALRTCFPKRVRDGSRRHVEGVMRSLHFPVARGQFFCMRHRIPPGGRCSRLKKIFRDRLIWAETRLATQSSVVSRARFHGRFTPRQTRRALSPVHQIRCYVREADLAVETQFSEFAFRYEPVLQFDYAPSVRKVCIFIRSFPVGAARTPGKRSARYR